MTRELKSRSELTSDMNSVKRMQAINDGRTNGRTSICTALVNRAADNDAKGFCSRTRDARELLRQTFGLEMFRLVSQGLREKVEE